MKHIISLGAGVQSSAMALLAAHGEILPMPDAAVFADTQAEPQGVYEWLAKLEKLLPFPVVRVTAGSLEADTIGSMALPRIANPPFYTAPFFNVNAGQEGQLRRQCTSEYKLAPVRKWTRAFVGLLPRQRAREVLLERWIGISTDEAHRAKLKPERFETIRYPLIELGMSRVDCLRWMANKGYPLPAKSACYFCPYTDDARWRDIKINEPQEFERAVAFDKAIRHGTVRGVNAPVYLHRSCKPLDEIDFRNAEDMGQARLFGGDPLDEKGFAVECEGMCGL